VKVRYNDGVEAEFSIGDNTTRVPVFKFGEVPPHGFYINDKVRCVKKISLRVKGQTVNEVGRTKVDVGMRGTVIAKTGQKKNDDQVLVDFDDIKERWGRGSLMLPADIILDKSGSRRRLAHEARHCCPPVVPSALTYSTTEETMTPSERVLHRRRLTHGVQTPVVLAALMEDIEDAKRNWTPRRR